MNHSEAKADLINFWGAIGSAWGINKTMAQVYAILLVSNKALSIEDIMEELNISRGNASMNVRNLMSWGLAFKEVRPGERKEFFTGEKDVWQMSRKVAAERKKREIEPLLAKLGQFSEIENATTSEAKEFKKVIKELHTLIGTFDSVLTKFINTNNKLAIKSIQALMAIS
ncbi:MAG: helix-turn-helix domain-containing protein [Bacteroidota bacterium]